MIIQPESRLDSVNRKENTLFHNLESASPVADNANSV